MLLGTLDFLLCSTYIVVSDSKIRSSGKEREWGKTYVKQVYISPPGECANNCLNFIKNLSDSVKNT